MEVTANAGKYKIIEYLVNETGYQAFVAVNIEKSTNDEVLINRYCSAESVRRFAPVIYDITRACSGEFIESFSEYGALCAVFTHRRGICVDKALLLKKQSAETRLALAKDLMHNALLQLSYPLLVRNASLAIENVLVDIPNQRVFFRRLIRPDADDGHSREQEMLSKYLPMVCKKDIFAPEAYWDFFEKLQESGFVNISDMFSNWCVCEGLLEQELADLQKQGKLKKLGPALTRWCKRKIKKKRRQGVRRNPDIENKDLNL